MNKNCTRQYYVMRNVNHLLVATGLMISILVTFTFPNQITNSIHPAIRYVDEYLQSENTPIHASEEAKSKSMKEWEDVLNGKSGHSKSISVHQDTTKATSSGKLPLLLPKPSSSAAPHSPASPKKETKNLIKPRPFSRKTLNDEKPSKHALFVQKNVKNIMQQYDLDQTSSIKAVKYELNRRNRHRKGQTTGPLYIQGKVFDTTNILPYKTPLKHTSAKPVG